MQQQPGLVEAMARALQDWIFRGDLEGARRCHALLRSCPQDAHAARLRQARAFYRRHLIDNRRGERLPSERSVRARHRLRRVIAEVPPECADVALLAALAHPDGHVRHAATDRLIGRTSPAAVAGLLFAADDHVLPVHTSATIGIGLLPIHLLARHPSPISAAPPGVTRAGWRADVLARLSAVPGCQALTVVACEAQGGRAMSALRLLERLGAPLPLQDLMGAASWRVRRHVVSSLVPLGGVDLVTTGLCDTRAAVRHAAVLAAARFTDAGERGAAMRLAIRDDTIRVRRVAAYHLRGDAAVLAQAKAALDAASPRRQARALATMVALAHPESRVVAERAVTAPSAAVRCAAFDALLDLGVLSDAHLAQVDGERSPRVIRHLASVLSRSPGVSRTHLAGLLTRGVLAGHPAMFALLRLLHPWDAVPVALRAAGEGWPGARRIVAAQSAALRRVTVTGWVQPSAAQCAQIARALGEHGDAAPRYAEAFICQVRDLLPS